MRFTRRDFLKSSFATAAAMALTACGRPVEHGLVSQYSMPEWTLPGQPVYWASSCPFDRNDSSVSVKTVEGRAIHVTGMPGHPYNKGVQGKAALSSLQALYHPDRLQQPKKGDKPAEWDAVIKELVRQLDKGAESNPLFIVERLWGSQGGLIMELASRMGAKILVADHHRSVLERRVLKAVCGRAELPFYPVEEADYLVTFGGDFLHNGYCPVRNSWAYGHFRKGRRQARGTMVSVSSRMGGTEANADRWLPVRPGTEGYVALAVGNLLSEQGKGKGSWRGLGGSLTLEQVQEITGLESQLIMALANRLGSAQNPLVVAGGGGAEGLFAAHSLNKLLRGDNPTYEPDLVLPVGSGRPGAGAFVSTEEALQLMESGNCETVWVFGANPVYSMAGGLDFGAKLEKIKNSVCFTTFDNDTSARCKLVVATRTWLEDWGDLRVRGSGLDIYNLQQPAVNSPWNKTRSTIDVLLQVAAASKAGAFDFADARALIMRGRDKSEWEAMLIRGGVWPEETRNDYPHRALHPPPPAPNPGSPPDGVSPYEALEPLQVTSMPSPPPAGAQLVPFIGSLGDGTMANLPWLQELPDVMTTVVWDSWVEINEQVAHDNHIERHDLVEITAGGQTFIAAAIPSPAVHPDTIAVPVGRGHENYGPWASIGVNPLKALAGTFGTGGEAAPITPVTIRKTGQSKLLTTFDTRLFNLPRHILPH